MSQPNNEFITDFCYSVNQLYIEDKELKSRILLRN